MHWLDRQTAGDVGTASVTASEILYGIGALPSGRRKTRLMDSPGAHWTRSGCCGTSGAGSTRPADLPGGVLVDQFCDERLVVDAQFPRLDGEQVILR